MMLTIYNSIHHYVGGTRCAPEIPYTGGTSDSPTFDPYTDVGPNGCTGQSDASWRIPLALQILPALILGIGKSIAFGLWNSPEVALMIGLQKGRS
jgi:hypothetical protein